MTHLRSAISLCALLTLAGCSGASATTPEEGFMDHAAYSQEYRASKAQLTFPPGYPATRERIEPDEEDNVWEVGSGTSDAVAEWNCAWGAEYLRTRTTSDRGAAALDMFTRIRETPAWDKAWPPDSQAVINQIISKAELGDPSEMQELVEANCSDLL